MECLLLKSAGGLKQSYKTFTIDTGSTKVYFRKPENLSDFDFQPDFRLSDIEAVTKASFEALPDYPRWKDALIHYAHLLMEHRFSFFDLKDYFLGNPVDWNRDHSSRKKAPLSYAQSIDYRDFQNVGDCKLVWEPNRQHQLVVLARAYRATGDIRYAEDVICQINSWLEECPYGRGMNWRSPMELSIRLINWAWAIDLIWDSGLFAGDFKKCLLQSVYQHLWEVTRKYSKGSSANNHLIGEAAGVFIAAGYFNMFKESSEWQKESKSILSKEIIVQTYSDGGGREQALGYLYFILQFFILCGIVARKTGGDFPQIYWQQIEEMLEFVGRLHEAGQPLSRFGDCDDGLRAGSGRRPLGPQGAACSRLQCYLTVRILKDGPKENVNRSFGLWANPDTTNIVKCRVEQKNVLRSRAFKESGYYLLQTGKAGSGNEISVIFDCGELGYGSIAAHGHADALSFSLRAFGCEIFVDPGTYDYFTYPEWRQYFRSTRGHNTLEVDDQDQSVMLGPFLWGARAKSRCLAWRPHERGGMVAGEHDGYSRLKRPLRHRRTLELDGAKQELTIEDEVFTSGPHSLAFYFHLSEMCDLASIDSNVCEITVENHKFFLAIDPLLSVHTLHGSRDPIMGWVSRGYHRKKASTTIIARGKVSGRQKFDCRVKMVARGGRE